MGNGRHIAAGRAILAALWFALLQTPSAFAQQASADAVKATFIYRFGSFVEWPGAAMNDPDTHFTICMTGSPGLAALVERNVDDQSIGGRAIAVRRLAAAYAHSGCHILFIENTPGQSVREALALVDGEPILTVTDARNGNSRGIIHFAIIDDRVRFHIDRRAAARNHVAINARLLALAVSVSGSGS